MFRSLLFFFLQTTSLLFWGVIVIVIIPFLSLEKRYKITMAWPKLNILLAKSLLKIDFEERNSSALIRNSKNPAIICCNHQSTWETFYLASFLPKPVCFIFKRELLFIPCFGWGIFLLKMIHINRKSGREAIKTIIEEASTQFSYGRWIIFFPEGTRVSPGEKKQYKLGAAILSKELDIPIIPVAHNAGLFWGKNALIKKPGKIILSVGQEIYPNGRTPKEIINEVKLKIEDLKTNRA